MRECSYGACVNEATHILVTYDHDIVDRGELFCSEHAFADGREKCPCCYDYRIEFGEIDLLPTYLEGALDHEGCCSEHP